MDGPDQQVGDLCKKCAPISFHKKKGYTLDLGTLRRVAQSQNCPLCRFILRSNPRRNVQDDPISTVSVSIFRDSHGSRCSGDIITLVSNIQSRSHFDISDAQTNSTASPDTRFIRAWLQRCDNHHLSSCHPSHNKATLPTRMRFLDVQEGRLVQASPGTQFIALSYVWGTSGNLLTTKANKNTLERAGALFAPDSNIPPLIRDVMQLVCEIGQRYLWVDALCIVQDDDNEKQEQISCMDAIYGNAYATIITIAADSVYSRVPGIGSQRNLTQYEVVKNKRFWYTSRPTLEDIVRDARWSTRGWTFQEHLLSRRRIFMANDEIFLECAKTAVSEFSSTLGLRYGHNTSINYARMPEQYHQDNLSHPGHIFNAFIRQKSPNEISTQTPQQAISPALPAGTAITLPDYQPSDRVDEDFKIYSQQVRQYTSRSLTYPSDILNAFTGLMSAWERIRGWQFLNGLPVQAFRRALCWVPLDVCETRRLEKDSIVLPTWSWAAWSGEICFVPMTNMHRDFIYCEESPSTQVFSIRNACGKTSAILSVHSPSATFTVSSENALLYIKGNGGPPIRPRIRMLIYDQKKRHCGVAWGISAAWFEQPGGRDFDCIYLFSSTRSVPETFEMVHPRSVSEAQEITRQRKTVPVLTMEQSNRAPREYDWIAFLDAQHGSSPGFRADPRWVFVLIVIRKGSFYERIGVGQIIQSAWKKSSPLLKKFDII